MVLWLSAAPATLTRKLGASVRWVPMQAPASSNEFDDFYVIFSHSLKYAEAKNKERKPNKNALLCIATFGIFVLLSNQPCRRAHIDWRRFPFLPIAQAE